MPWSRRHSCKPRPLPARAVLAENQRGSRESRVEALFRPASGSTDAVSRKEQQYFQRRSARELPGGRRPFRARLPPASL